MNEHATVSLFQANLAIAAADLMRVIPISDPSPAISTFVTSVSQYLTTTQTVFEQLPAAAMPEDWREDEYREAYMVASIEQGVAWQIRVNREGRDLSQSTLAKMIGTRQSAISRMEDPEYGNHNLGTLVKLANAFKCALSVKFIPYSQLAIESEDLSPEALFAAPYEAECAQVECRFQKDPELDYHDQSTRYLLP